MPRVAVSLLGGLAFSLACLLLAFAADGAVFHLHWLRDIFIKPPLFVLTDAVPALSPSLAIEPGSTSGRMSFFAGFALVFWWVVGMGIIATLQHLTRRST